VSQAVSVNEVWLPPGVTNRDIRPVDTMKMQVYASKIRYGRGFFLTREIPRGLAGG
jgi:ribosomal protein L13E